MLYTKKGFAVFVCLVVIAAAFSGCTDSFSGGYARYSYEFLGAFDTVTQIIGYAKSEREFEAMAKWAETRFTELHRLFDIYNDYEGINNIKTINDNAGIKPVKVSREIIDLILFSKEWHDKTGGVVNIAMGPVLSIWHEYREYGIEHPDEAELPPMEKLREASRYCDIDKVIVDTGAQTVYLEDKNMSIDVGAVAKGFAVELLAKELQEKGYASFLINAGGNVKVVGKPLDGNRTKWGIGIMNPDYDDSGNREDSTLDTIYTDNGAVVTSGDYQRYYKVDGKIYHHLIDPGTLMPATYYRSVSVYTQSSAEADFLSTTLFLSPYEKGRKIAGELDGVEALWVFPDGHIEVTDGMKSMLKIMGGASNK